MKNVNKMYLPFETSTGIISNVCVLFFIRKISHFFHRILIWNINPKDQTIMETIIVLNLFLRGLNIC